MAVQQNKKSRSARDMRRSHDALSASTLSVEKTTGEIHLRHHGIRLLAIRGDAGEFHRWFFLQTKC